MKTQNNLNKIIYKLIIFVIAYIPISVHANDYKDCEAITPFYIKNGLCTVQVQNCRKGNRLVSGSSTCDIEHVTCPASPLVNCDPTRCPTDPNECANDNEGDGRTNYTNTAPPTLLSHEPYHSCKKTGDTTIQDDKCHIAVTDCRQGSSALTKTGTATCDVLNGRASIICNRMEPPTCQASCPTNPNECANDDDDGSGNYTNTERITFTPNRYYKDSFQNNTGRGD